jgi:hypothetical protein
MDVGTDQPGRDTQFLRRGRSRDTIYTMVVWIVSGWFDVESHVRIKNSRGGSRTRNLPLRRRTHYPLCYTTDGNEAVPLCPFEDEAAGNPPRICKGGAGLGGPTMRLDSEEGMVFR